MQIKFQQGNENIENINTNSIFTVWNNNKEKLEFERISDSDIQHKRDHLGNKTVSIKKQKNIAYKIEIPSFKSSNANSIIELLANNKVLAFKPTKEQLKSNNEKSYTLDSYKEDIFNDLSNYSEFSVKDLDSETYILSSINLNGRVTPLSRKIISIHPIEEKEALKLSTNNFLIIENVFVKLN